MIDPADEAARHDSLRVDHYSVDHLPVAQRHDAWAATRWPSVAALFDSRPLEDFSTEADLVRLDRLFLQYARGTARAFERPAGRSAQDGIDVLGVGIQLDGGPMSGRAGDRAFVAPPGAMLLLDMTRSCSIVHPSGRSIQIALPRELAQAFLGPLPPLHGAVVSAEASAMLVSHLLQLRQALPAMEQGQQTILMRTVLDLLAVALGRQAVVELPTPADDEGSVADLDGLARREIELRLGLPSLTAASLCQRLGVSRSTLFRLFQNEGGVQSYIRSRRLEAVRRALAERGSPASVGELAYRYGFSDASHLTRLFKAAYGTTPTAFRASHRGPAAG
jgi:AraC-like DNA-binding protein